MLETSGYIESACSEIKALSAEKGVQRQLNELSDVLRLMFARRVDRNIHGVADAIRSVLETSQYEAIPRQLRTRIQGTLLTIFADVARAHVTFVEHPRSEWLHPPIESKKERDTPRSLPLGDRLEQYVGLAAMVGTQEAIQALAAMGVLGDEEHAPAVRILRRYLGKSAPPSGQAQSIYLPSGSAIDNSPVVYEETRQALVRHVYQHLLQGDELDIQDKRVSTLLSELQRNAGVDEAEFHTLIGDVRRTFAEVASYTPPESWVDTLEMNGEEQRFPSLRQRLALQEILRSRHGILSFAPGMGKTAVSLMLYHYLLEIVKNKPHQLYIGPKGPNQQLPNYIQPQSAPGNVLHSYYRDDVPPENRPSIGRIYAGIKEDDVEIELTKDIVFVDDTMLTSRRGDKTIAKHIAACKRPFTIVTIDECHRAKGGGPVTRALTSLCDNIPNLRSKGYIVGISATPSPNTLKDLATIAAIIDPSVQTLDPSSALRRARRMIVNFDPRASDDWEQRMQSPRSYALDTDAQTRIRRIRFDATLNARTKMITMQKIIFESPAFRDALKESIIRALNAGTKSLLIATHHIAQGVTRPHDEGNESKNVADLFEAIEEWCREWSSSHDERVYFNSIDGSSNEQEQERQAIFEQCSNHISGASNKRSVTLVNAACVNIGRDFRGIMDYMLCAGWPYCQADMEQLVGRMRGERIPIEVMYASRTIEEAIKTWAELKQDVVDRFLGYGNTTDEHLQRALRAAEEPENDMHLRDLVTSLCERAGQARWVLQHQGLRTAKRWWQSKKRRKLHAEIVKHPEESGEGNYMRYVTTHLRHVESAVGRSRRILHVYAQGMSLARTLKEANDVQKREIISVELCEHMIATGKATLSSTPGIEAKCGLLHRMSTSDKSSTEEVDTVIVEGLEYAQHQNNSEQPETAQKSELIQTIEAAVHHLKQGGTLIIHIRHDAWQKQTFDALKHALESAGLQIHHAYTGEAESAESITGEDPIRMYTITAVKMQRSFSLDTFNLPTITEDTDPLPKTGKKKAKGETHRILPHPLSHTEFRLKSNKFQYPASSTLRKTIRKQRACVEAVSRAVKKLRQYAPTATDYAALTSKKKGELLVAAGIEPHPDLDMKHRPAFIIPAWPELTLYPFDAQWNEDSR